VLVNFASQEIEMRSWNLEGQCRCGQVRIKTSAPPLLTMACHCTGCQRMSASAFSLSAAFPAASFSVSQGETVIGGLHGPAGHHFCAHCKSWMFTRSEGMEWFVNVRPTMFEDVAWFTPFVETYASKKFPWASTGAVHSFDEFPPLEAYEGLMKEYSKGIST
jgi:hypothetical protein